MNEKPAKVTKRRRRCAAEEKRQIYAECKAPGAKIGDILHAHGMYAGHPV